MSAPDMLALIADDTRQVSYRPRWNSFTGSIAATILLQQVIYRWVHHGRTPFYKFNEPCQHPAYRDGDSWSEELGFTRRELETARNKIAAYTQGDLDKKALVSYWRDADRKTWYALNEQAVIKELLKIYPPQRKGNAGIQGRMDLPDGPSDLMAESANSNEKTADLMAESAISKEENGDLMAESANSQWRNPPLAYIQRIQQRKHKRRQQRTQQQQHAPPRPRPHARRLMLLRRFCPGWGLWGMRRKSR